MCVPSLRDPGVVCHHLLCFPGGSTPDCYGLTPVNATDGWREGRIDRRVDGLIDGRMRRWDTINHRGRALLITAAADKMRLLPSYHWVSLLNSHRCGVPLGLVPKSWQLLSTWGMLHA